MRTGTSEDVRRDNLTAVLRALMVGGPTSRAELGRLTGRNRSTVASLVSDLVDLGLANENEPISDGKVGRPSHGVALDASVAAFAIHPEVDALTVAIVGLDARVRRKVRHDFKRIPSMRDVVQLAVTVMGAMGAEESGYRICGVGVAVPGLVRTADGLVRSAPAPRVAGRAARRSAGRGLRAHRPRRQRRPAGCARRARLRRGARRLPLRLPQRRGVRDRRRDHRRRPAPRRCPRLRGGVGPHPGERLRHGRHRRDHGHPGGGGHPRGAADHPRLRPHGPRDLRGRAARRPVGRGWPTPCGGSRATWRPRWAPSSTC